MAELPKNKPLVRSAFSFVDILRGVKTRVFNIAFIALVYLSTVSVALVVLSTLSADEQETFLEAEASIEWKAYRNETFGYTVFYPNHWFPSGIRYSNAFEIRNYKLKNFQSVPERNRATLIIVDTVNENAIVTDNFLESLLEGKSQEERRDQILTIDGHRAVRVHEKTPPQQLGPGTAKALGLNEHIDKSRFYLEINTYIDNGKHLISIKASVPENTEASVIEDIIKIEESLKFN
jgi:hypothetical protein